MTDSESFLVPTPISVSLPIHACLHWVVCLHDLIHSPCITVLLIIILLFSVRLSPPLLILAPQSMIKKTSLLTVVGTVWRSVLQDHTHFFFFSCYSCILFSSVGRCVVLCTVCICVCLSIHVCRSVWEEENVMSVHLTYINYFLCFYVFCDTKISIEIK